MKALDAALLLAGPIMQAWLAALLLRRRAHKSFRFFFIYTIFSVIAGTAEFSVHPDPWEYFFVYWAAEFVYVVLGFLVIDEVFRWTFREFYLFLWWFKYLLPGMGVVIVAASVVYGIFFPPIQAPPVLATIYVAEIAVRCLQVVVFALFVALARFFSVLWRIHAFAILTGFAVSAFGSFLTFSLSSGFGTKIIPITRYIAPVAYTIAVAVWVVAFHRPEPPDEYAGIASPLTPQQLTHLMRQYTRQVKDWFKRCPALSS